MIIFIYIVLVTYFVGFFISVGVFLSAIVEENINFIKDGDAILYWLAFYMIVLWPLHLYNNFDKC